MIETNEPWRDRLVSAPVFFQAQQSGEVTGRRHAHSAFERESEILVVCSISNGAGGQLCSNSIELRKWNSPVANDTFLTVGVS